MTHMCLKNFKADLRNKLDTEQRLRQRKPPIPRPSALLMLMRVLSIKEFSSMIYPED